MVHLRERKKFIMAGEEDWQEMGTEKRPGAALSCAF